MLLHPPSQCQLYTLALLSVFLNPHKYLVRGAERAQDTIITLFSVRVLFGFSLASSSGAIFHSNLFDRK